MDLVDEEQLAFLQAREQAGEVGGLFDDRSRSHANGPAHFFSEDHRQGGLAQAGRAVEQDVVECAPFAASGPDHHAEAFHCARLANEIGEGRRAQCLIERAVGRAHRGLAGGGLGRFCIILRAGHGGNVSSRGAMAILSPRRSLSASRKRGVVQCRRRVSGGVPRSVRTHGQGGRAVAPKFPP